MERKRRIAGMIMAAMAVMIKCAESRLLKIGERGWIPDYNYTEWLNQRHNHFYVGDWLLNQTSYEDCNDQGFIFNVTRGGRDVYQLKEARPYYFLSSGGYCWNGMKLAISVEELAPTPAPAPPAKSDSPSSSTCTYTMILPVSFYVALAWVVFLKP
ncbi:lamin-like protein isoform X2 [Ricinus communis]|uniref:lamin-like protein isoform X2 n=1 Tax=Ricinus communis TaxID=3988 RepID=UPI000772A9AE|nr:lamin-like protein isoform X2 [Ricinus communis]|eukprot:XP_015583136.1 lamin-like protein isoform X2 [Ricinus communis]